MTDQGTPASSRSRPGNVDAALVALLVAGLVGRIIIAYALPGSGFRADLVSFQYWASNLASEGLGGFYTRDFFHDYTPGYLYVLWVVGMVGSFVGGVGDLIKIPPILADLGLAYVVWSMALELGASRRAAFVGGFLVVVNPVTWFDSVLWGQVDSVGVLVLLLALRELWRDRPERAAILAMLAAMIKPQLGLLIPIVAIVTIRRAFWPEGGFGADEVSWRDRWGTGWERSIRGPIRVVTTALAGLATAFVLSFPFGLSLPELVVQLFKTAAGYPYLSVNAYNPWALVSQAGNGVAANHVWVCDSTVVPSGAFSLKLGDLVILQEPASNLSCPTGFMIGALPAVLVGMGLFLAALAVICALVARRPDPRTMLVGLTVLSIAFFVLPTRVHERYLFPLVGLGAVLAAVSLRWRLAYLIASVAMLANMYAVLTVLYPDNPGIADWLGIGPALTSFPGVASIALAQTVVFVWAFAQLRRDALDDLEREIEADDGAWDAGLASGLARPGLRRFLPVFGSAAAVAGTPEAATASPATMNVTPRASDDTAAISPSPADRATGGARVLANWEDRETAGTVGILGWFRARFNDRPVRADRSRELAGERGGRLDRLDLWLIAVLLVSVLTVRIWRLAEPYEPHFDEVYHPRTAAEFLQDWRYGIPHDVYEWTHPHLAKYAMALGIMAFGDDRVDATSQIGLPVRAAEIEPRWDDTEHARSGDRLWVVGGDQVRAYDLFGRQLEASWSVPGASAVTVDRQGHEVFVGTDAGGIAVVDTTVLDSLRATGIKLGDTTASDAATPAVEPLAWTSVDSPIVQLHATGDGSALVAVVPSPAGNGVSTVVTFDIGATTEQGRVDLTDVRQIADHGTNVVAIADASEVDFLDTTTGDKKATVRLDGPVGGLAQSTGLTDDPLYVSYKSADGARIATVTGSGTSNNAVKETTFQLPGTTAGRAYFDDATKMVHVLGTTPDAAAQPTVYVILPIGTPRANAVYADAALGFDPAAVVMDDNRAYPSSDRQQLLALSPTGGVASIETGRHAWAWRLPGVIAGAIMAALLYVLARLLFRRREVAVILGFLVVVDGLLFVQSRIGMNDPYVGLGIVAAYTLFAALWLKPSGSRRSWIAFALGMPVLGVTLGLALASKWVAAYAIGGLGILVLSRSALGRLLLNAALVVLTAALGYIAISTPGGANYGFLAIMVGLTLVSVMVTVLRPIAWTWEEQRLAIAGPIAIGGAIALAALATDRLSDVFTLGPVVFTPIQLALLALLVGAGAYTVFVAVGRLGFGPMAARDPDNPSTLVDPPEPAPRGWLNLGSGFGVPAFWALACLTLLPVAIYVLSYVPWAFNGNNQILAGATPGTGWPPNHTGQTLIDLTGQMYRYHNNLTTPHPASSPWWAWPLDLKPVWFYQASFAGGTSASIYDAGNLISWWLGIPAMGFLAWQAFARRSAALALVGIAFAAQWLAWARIDRAAFQYHYYTAIPFVLIALAYLLAELWRGASWRTWVLARLSAAALVLGPFGLWLLHRPLCAVVRVNDINPGSQACPTLIPDIALSPRAIGIALVVGIGLLLLVRELLAASSRDDGSFAFAGAGGSGGGGGGVMALGLGRFRNAALIALVTSIAFVIVTRFIPPSQGASLTSVPIEPIALIVEIALLPVAAFVATARDSRRFVIGALVAIGFFFVLWYPNISALPLPSNVSNAFQGLLPTYLYPFQFWVNQTPRDTGPPLLSVATFALMASMALVAVAVGYSTWSWRVALAQRRHDAELAPLEPEAGTPLEGGGDRPVDGVAEPPAEMPSSDDRGDRPG